MLEEKEVMQPQDYANVQEDGKGKKLWSNLSWHSVQTFCAYFAFISLFGFILSRIFPASPIKVIHTVMLFAGFACAMITAAKETFKLLHTVAKWLSVTVGALFAFVPIPFINVILMWVMTAFFYLWVFAFGLFLMFFVPYIPTMIAYFTHIRQDKSDNKQELFTAVGGVLCAVILFVIMLIVSTIGMAAKTSAMQKSFNREQLYTEYISQYQEDNTIDIDINNPSQSTFSAKEETQIDVYEVRQELRQGQNNLAFDSVVTIRYGYYEHLSGWKMSSVDIQRNLDDYTVNASGTYTGYGPFSGNIMTSQNQYTLVIDQLTKEGGTGKISVVDREFLDEHQSFTITPTCLSEAEDDVILEMDIVFAEALSNGDESATATYSFKTGELWLYGLGYDETLLTIS